MKKALIALILILLIAVGVWAYMRVGYVIDSPSDAYLRTVAAALLGDEDGFLDGFTEESRPLVSGLLYLAKGADPKDDRAHPYHLLVTEAIEEEVIEGDRAWLRVRRLGSKNRGSMYDIPMTRASSDESGNGVVPGPWKIDARSFTGKKREVSKVRGAGAVQSDGRARR